jgi:hypothetical protein
MAFLAQSFTPRQDAALIAEMLSLPNDGRYLTLELPRGKGDRKRWKRPRHHCRLARPAEH